MSLAFLDVFFPLVSVFSLVFWLKWMETLMTRDSLGLVGCLQWDFYGLYYLLGLGVNIGTRVPNTCVAAEVLGTSLVSVIPNTAWPPVKQGSSVKFMDQNMKSRVGGCSLGMLGML